MPRGRISWTQRVEARYDNLAATIEVASQLRVNDANAPYLIGNAHFFRVPTTAQLIVVEEITQRNGKLRELSGVYTSGTSLGSQLYHDNDRLEVYPLAKRLAGLEAFEIACRYTTLWNRPSSARFFVEIGIYLYNRAYLDNLECFDSEIVNSVEVYLYPPPQCVWADIPEMADLIRDAVVKSRAMDLGAGPMDLSVSPTVAMFRLIPNNYTLTASHVNIVLHLPVYQDPIEQRAFLDGLDRAARQPAAETVVTFVCDLKGSTAQAVGGAPSVDVLRYHKIWRRDSVKPFRLLKIIGDQIFIVLAPEALFDGAMEDILMRFNESVGLGFRIRGGFHIGQAQAVGAPADTMVGSAIGEEFLGDALNMGAKIGDLKENPEGLLASEEFMQLLSEVGSASALGDHWKDVEIGGKIVKLYRLKIEALQHLPKQNLGA